MRKQNNHEKYLCTQKYVTRESYGKISIIILLYVFFYVNSYRIHHSVEIDKPFREKNTRLTFIVETKVCHCVWM